MASGLHVSSVSPPIRWRLQQLLLLVVLVVSGQGTKRKRSESCQEFRQSWAWPAQCHFHTFCWSEQVKRPQTTRGGEINSTQRSSKVISPRGVQGRSETTCHTTLEVRRGWAWASEHGLFLKKKKSPGLKRSTQMMMVWLLT